jgi:hypothetical protein
MEDEKNAQFVGSNRRLCTSRWCRRESDFEQAICDFGSMLRALIQALAMVPRVDSREWRMFICMG